MTSVAAPPPTCQLDRATVVAKGHNRRRSTTHDPPTVRRPAPSAALTDAAPCALPTASCLGGGARTPRVAERGGFAAQAWTVWPSPVSSSAPRWPSPWSRPPRMRPPTAWSPPPPARRRSPPTTARSSTASGTDRGTASPSSVRALDVPGSSKPFVADIGPGPDGHDVAVDTPRRRPAPLRLRHQARAQAAGGKRRLGLRRPARVRAQGRDLRAPLRRPPVAARPQRSAERRRAQLALRLLGLAAVELRAVARRG